MKHTPGPWEIRNPEQAGEAMLGIVSYGTRYPQGLAYIGITVGLHAEADLANAHLIAAAPELLAALELARDALYNGFEPDNQSAAYHKICTVIAKAEGL